MSPYRQWAEAVAFARRGWVAVAFLRRGHGRSQGRMGRDLWRLF